MPSRFSALRLLRTFKRSSSSPSVGNAQHREPNIRYHGQVIVHWSSQVRADWSTVGRTKAPTMIGPFRSALPESRIPCTTSCGARGVQALMGQKFG